LSILDLLPVLHSSVLNSSSLFNNLSCNRRISIVEAISCVPRVIAGGPRQLRLKRGEEVVDSPSKDYDVINVEEKAYDCCGVPNTCN
jgi:hypothetical protein